MFFEIPVPRSAGTADGRRTGPAAVALVLLCAGVLMTAPAERASAQRDDASEAVPNWNDERPLDAPLAEILRAEPIDAGMRAPGAPVMQVEPRAAQTGTPEVRSITLDAALALAVKQNLGVEVARYEPLIAEQDMEGAWGAYDPVFTGDVGYQLTENPNTFLLNPVSKNQERAIRGGLGLSGLVPYVGATLGIEMDTARTRTNSGIQAFSPQYDSSIFLTARIPLLRGLIWNEAWTQVKVSKIGFGATVDRFRQSVMDITESTINAYWDVVARREQLEVAEKSLETATALLSQTQTQYEVGVVSRVEVVEAEAGVADREFNLITAQNQFENAEDVLIDAVLGRELQATTNMKLTPVSDTEGYEFRVVDVERAVATALRNLPEIAAAERQVEQKEIELKFAKNARLPRFDVDARYGYVNNSGDRNIRACGFGLSPAQQTACVLGQPKNGGFQSSFDNMYNGEDGFENYTVTGTFSIPIPNRAARRNVQKSEFDLRRSKTQKARTEQDIILGVRAAARGLAASARGIEAAERRRLAAEEQLRAERIRLEHGESTPFEVLQRESDLVEAESQKIGALQSYRAAEARLERAQGTILESHRIEIADVQNDPIR